MIHYAVLNVVLLSNAYITLFIAYSKKANKLNPLDLLSFLFDRVSIAVLSYLRIKIKQNLFKVYP